MICDKYETGRLYNGRHFYRYETMLLCDGELKLTLNVIPVLRQTRCGVQLNIGYKKTKFINSESKKKWAYPTKEEAFQGFLARKMRQVAILEYNLEIAKGSLQLTPENDSVQLEGCWNNDYM
jgi:hypothetical protein